MSKQPYIPFYVGDWLSDPNVSMLSSSARGIWIDLLCAMHKNDRSGEISGSVPQLSRVARCTIEELELTLDELKSTKTADVTICNGIVTIINRRMKKESKERESTRERVKKYRDKKEDKIDCNGDVQKSNAFYDSEDEIENKDEPVIGNIIVKEIIEDLNNLMSTNYRISSKKTQSLINARLKEDFTLDDFKTVHRKMFDCWFNDSKMAKFLRPETLYGNKFESYLNQKEVNTLMSDVSIHNKKVIESWIRKKENED